MILEEEEQEEKESEKKCFFFFFYEEKNNLEKRKTRKIPNLVIGQTNSRGILASRNAGGSLEEPPPPAATASCCLKNAISFSWRAKVSRASRAALLPSALEPPRVQPWAASAASSSWASLEVIAARSRAVREGKGRSAVDNCC